MVKRGIVLSDLHIGSGHRKGQINIYDDFREDERLSQLLARYSSGEAANDEVHLVLNGDIFDLLKVPVNGKFPDAITERLALMKLEQCVKGHPLVMRAFARFLGNGKNQLTYQPGNHDMELHFPAVQKLFCRAVTGEDAHPRLRVISDVPSFTLEDGVHFHHGHQFEAIHAMDFKRLFLTRGQREPILNLPWGSLFILNVVNQLVRERPYLDKVNPFWPLFVGGMLLDTRFTMKMVADCGVAFARARLNPMWWDKRPFEKVSRFFSDQIGFFEQLDRQAGKILKASPDSHAVFMGHTHLEMLRTVNRDKVYVNTGSWLPMVNLRISNLGQSLKLHYGHILWRDDGPPRIGLMRWHGTKPDEEEVIS
jgi:UDP-2,3-diacylglucosamine pyrophosphatase LpxH